jgi:hypothetical protein
MVAGPCLGNNYYYPLPGGRQVSEQAVRNDMHQIIISRRTAAIDSRRG